MLLPDISDWDFALIEQLADKNRPETLNVELKSSAALAFRTDGKLSDKGKECLACQVCAFSNAEGGFIVFGVNDAKHGGGIDSGLPASRGTEPIKDWAEKVIHTLLMPPVTGCEARFIEYPSHPGHGALVVHAPQSEQRPHWWVAPDGQGRPYLRVGAHSAPMFLQTFLDIRSRGRAPRAEILPPEEWGLATDQHFSYLQLYPLVRLLGGPFCEKWAMEISFPDKNAAQFQVQQSIEFQRPTPNQVFLTGWQPLYQQRPTAPVGTVLRIDFADRLYPRSGAPLELKLWCESAAPVTRTEKMGDLMAIASRPRP